MLAPLGAAGNKKTKVKVEEIQGSYVKVKYVDPVVKRELGNKSFLLKRNNLEVVNEVREDGNRVDPARWVSQEMKQFPEWINRTFLRYRVKNRINTKKDFTSYQKFIRDYLQLKSPYRGLLLYHGLGSGKTCSSIAVAESINNSVIVLSPATLKGNYVKALRSDPVCGVEEYGLNNKKIGDKYEFISYNAPNTIEQLDRISSLDNHVIVIDEVHNLVSMIVSGSKKGPEIYRRLMEARNVKIVALSGTPIINYPFEVSILANILRGYIEVVSIYIKDGKSLDTRVEMLKSELGKLDGVEYVDHNQRFLNLYLFYKSWQSEFDVLVGKVLEVGAKMGTKLEYLETKRYSLFPEDEEEFRKYFIEETTDGELLKNRDLLMRRLLGLISYYRGGKSEFYPVVNPVKFEEVRMSLPQFNAYREVRDVERDKEKSGAMQKLLGKAATTSAKGSEKKISSLFKVFSRQFSNFVFPDKIERPFVRKFLKTARLKKLEKKAKTSNKAAAELEAELEAEDKRAEGDEFDAKDRVLIDKALEELGRGKERYLRDELGVYSPKMERMLGNIRAGVGKVLVYSTFRSLEGIGVFELVLQANGFERLDVDRPKEHPDVPKYAIYSGVEDDVYKEKVIKIFNEKNNLYGEILKVLMVSAAGAEGLDLKAIRQVHVMEPYWHDVRIDQVIGRANRFMSHIDLPVKDRVVDVYRYVSLLPQGVAYDEKESTDEYIYEIAQKKMRVTEEIKRVMKEIAVDCVLNAVDNEKDLKCFTFGLDARGLAYKADLREDYVYGRTEIGVKEVTKKLEPMFMDGKGRLIWADKKAKKLCYFNDKECKEPLGKVPRGMRKVGVDRGTLEVFDVEGVGYGNLVRLGVVDEMGMVV